MWTGAISNGSYGRLWVKGDAGRQAVRLQKGGGPQKRTGTSNIGVLLGAQLFTPRVGRSVWAGADAAEEHGGVRSRKRGHSWWQSIRRKSETSLRKNCRLF